MRHPDSPIIRMQFGAQRSYWSMRIFEHLKRQGLCARDLAQQLGISDSAVYATISGRNHSARVLQALREVGVPEKYLFDPRLDQTRKEAVQNG